MQFSDAEWIVMRALWRAEPATVRDIHDKVAAETGWAYSTVKTILARLAEKGAVAATHRGNARLFQSAVTRSQARGTALGHLLQKAFDGAVAPLLQQLVADERLSAQDRAELAALLAAEQGGEDDGSPRAERGA